jgi:small subunit ribosomal protein S10e
MLVPFKEKKIIYMQIFKDGILVVKKDRNFLTENGLKMDSLITIKIMKGLVSKGLANETFNWKFYYFVLNDKGIQFLRKFLNIPDNVVPLTLTSI